MALILCYYILFYMLFILIDHLAILYKSSVCIFYIICYTLETSRHGLVIDKLNNIFQLKKAGSERTMYNQCDSYDEIRLFVRLFSINELKIFSLEITISIHFFS